MALGRICPWHVAAAGVLCPAWPTAASAHSHTHPGPLRLPPGSAPRAAPLSACPLLCLPPPFPGGAWASGWRVDFSSLCKQVVAECQVGRRQAGAAPQPGCAKHGGTAWGAGKGETGRHPERERHSDACRQTQGSLIGHTDVETVPENSLLLSSPTPTTALGPLPLIAPAESCRPRCPIHGHPHPLLLLSPPPPLRAGYAIINL